MFAVKCPNHIVKGLTKILKKRKFELQIIFFWLTFCLPGNIVLGYLYNVPSLQKDENNSTEMCQLQSKDNPIKEKVGQDFKMPKGSFNIYVNKILTFFDHPPTPSKQT